MSERHLPKSVLELREEKEYDSEANVVRHALKHMNEIHFDVVKIEGAAASKSKGIRKDLINGPRTLRDGYGLRDLIHK